VWGNKFLSPLLDRYLARTGFKAQQDTEPVSPTRKDNLFDPVPGDHGAHGRFDREAVDSSAELWVSMHKKEIALAAVGAAAAAGAGFMLAGRSRSERRAAELETEGI